MKNYQETNPKLNDAVMQKKELLHILGGFEDRAMQSIEDDLILEAKCNDGCRKACKDGCKGTSK